MIPACRFRVTSLSCQAALALSLSGFAPDLNRIELFVVCHCEQSSIVIKKNAACCLVIHLQQLKLAQLYKYLHQSGNAVSGNAVSGKLV